MGKKVRSTLRKLGIVLLAAAVFAGAVWIADAVYWANQPKEVSRVWEGILLLENGETRHCTVRLDGILRRMKTPSNLNGPIAATARAAFSWTKRRSSI